MQTNQITKWAALLLTVSGMAALPLTVSAQNKYVTSGTVVETGSSYQSISSRAALEVVGNGASYSGTNITLSSAINSKAGVYIDSQGSVSLFDSTITAAEIQSMGIQLVSSSVSGSNIKIDTSGSNGRALYLRVGSHAVLDDIEINTSGEQAFGMQIDSGTIQARNVRINTSGDGACGLFYGSHGLGPDEAYVYIADSTIEVSGGDAPSRKIGAIYMASGNGDGARTLVADNTTFTAAAGAGIYYLDRAGEYNVTLRNGSSVTGTAVVVVDGMSAITTNITVEGNSSLNGNVNVRGGENLNMEINITGNSSLTGDVNVTGTANVTVNLNNSVLTGASSLLDDAVLTVAVDNNSTWNMTADSQLTNLALSNSGKVIFQNMGGYKTLTVGNLSGSGEFHMNTDLAANTGDLLDITGTSAGSHQVRITNHGNNTAGTEPALLMVRTADGQASFSGTVSVGMFDYSLYKDGSDWYLSASGTNLPPTPPDPEPTDPNPPTPPTPQPGDVGKDILTNTPGGQAPGWFDHNDNIGNHLTDLRDSNRNATVSGRSGDKDVSLSAASILNSVWIKAYGAQLNISGNVAGVGVREFDYGTDIGADHQWQLDRNNTLIAGAFVGYGHTDRETRNNFGGESNTDNFRLGLYGIWLNNSGWFADVIAKGQYADSHLNAYDASFNHTTADYDNWGGGISADFGRRFDFEHGWFVEPSVSAAYAHLTGSDYTTGGDNIFSVSTTDADVFQFKIGVAFGRTIKLSNSGVLQPYLKVAGVEQISTGGKVRASGSEWRPNFDGARAEIGGGIIWQLNANHQLSLDYEASFGDKFDKPWGLTAGYRYQF